MAQHFAWSGPRVHSSGSRLAVKNPGANESRAVRCTDTQQCRLDDLRKTLLDIIEEYKQGIWIKTLGNLYRERHERELKAECAAHGYNSFVPFVQEQLGGGVRVVEYRALGDVLVISAANAAVNPPPTPEPGLSGIERDREDLTPPGDPSFYPHWMEEDLPPTLPRMISPLHPTPPSSRPQLPSLPSWPSLSSPDSKSSSSSTLSCYSLNSSSASPNSRSQPQSSGSSSPNLRLPPQSLRFQSPVAQFWSPGCPLPPNVVRPQALYPGDLRARVATTPQTSTTARMSRAHATRSGVIRGHVSSSRGSRARVPQSVAIRGRIFTPSRSRKRGPRSSVSRALQF